MWAGISQLEPNARVIHSNLFTGADRRGFPQIVGMSEWFPSGTEIFVPEGGRLLDPYCRFGPGPGGEVGLGVAQVTMLPTSLAAKNVELLAGSFSQLSGSMPVQCNVWFHPPRHHARTHVPS